MFNFFLFISGMILAMCISEMIYQNSSIEAIYSPMSILNILTNLIKSTTIPIQLCKYRYFVLIHNRFIIFAHLARRAMMPNSIFD